MLGVFLAIQKWGLKIYLTSPNDRLRIQGLIVYSYPPCFPESNASASEKQIMTVMPEASLFYKEALPADIDSSSFPFFSAN
jgi:hypothetical protein